MAPDPKNIDWRGRRLWQTAGYFASAAWMIYVLAETGGRVEDKLFDYIFIVPIGIWTVGIAVAWLVKKLAGRQ